LNLSELCERNSENALQSQYHQFLFIVTIVYLIERVVLFERLYIYRS